MTQEQKELLIQDLCARLPYGVRVIDIRGIRRLKEFTFNTLIALDKYEFKPILFPMSAINYEIQVDGKEVNVRDTINSFCENGLFVDSEGDICIENTDVSYIFLHTYNLILDTFNRYHIDYRGLIDKGLAISVFDLSENPYKFLSRFQKRKFF